MRALQEAARTYWRDLLETPRIECGLDIAAALTPEIDDRTTAAAAAKADIELRPLSDHSRRPGRLNGFVVGFAPVDARSIRDGASRLAGILEKQIHRPAPQR
jgi:GntR family transcriptional regulator/MocR family aminotransferase